MRNNENNNLAPDGNWNYYISPIKEDDRPLYGDKTMTIESSSYKITGGNSAGYYPYRPGYRNISFGAGDWLYILGMSAGTDCVGFVQRVVNAVSTDYDWKDIPLDRCFGWDQNTDEIKTLNDKRQSPWNVNNAALFTGAGVAPNIDDLATKANHANLEHVIPGDIFYWAKKDANGNIIGGHVAMVRSVSFVGNVRTTEMEHIRLIEATRDDIPLAGRVARVIRTNTVQSYENRGFNWIIKRIKYSP